MGVKNIPPLAELPLLDRGKGVVVDEMHGAFLGVAKVVLTIWLKEMTKETVNCITLKYWAGYCIIFPYCNVRN